MRAVQISRYGGNDVVEVNANVAEPRPGMNQVVVRVHAAGVNPSDWKIRQGLFKDWVPLNFPATLGADFSGVVTEVGAGVTALRPGDRVYGRAGYGRGGSGSLAEFLAGDVGVLAPAPRHLTHLEAAAMPLVGVSAWQALVEHIGLTSGQKILIHGGAGGIGSVAVQLAKHLGALVATTVATKDVDFVRALGADEVIDYQTQDFESLVQACDAVFDMVGGKTFARSFATLKPGGTIVSMAHPSAEPPTESGIRVVAQQTKVTADRLARLAELLDKGVLKVHVDKIFPLGEAREALLYMETGHPKGKVVVEVAREP